MGSPKIVFSCRRFLVILDNLRELVQRQDIMNLLALVTMFSCAGVDGLPGVAELARCYMDVVRRRLVYREGDVEEKVFGRFTSALCDIKELAKILQRLTITEMAASSQQGRNLSEKSSD